MQKSKPTSTMTMQQPAEVQEVAYIELYVGNLPQASYYYKHALGFMPIAYKGPESGQRGRSSLALRQGSIHLVLTAASDPEDPVVRYVHRHGDSIQEIAFAVDDASIAFSSAVALGATPVTDPLASTDEFGSVMQASISGCGSMTHSFVERKNYHGMFLPGYQSLTNTPAVEPAGLCALDHISFCFEKDTLDTWMEFYERTFGFVQHYQAEVSTEYSGMKTKAMRSPSGTVQFVLIEGAESRRKSQIEEYLYYNAGPGVQHLAFLTRDLVSTLRRLRGNGVEFLTTPAAYYDHVENRVGRMEDSIEVLRELNILVDRDEAGQLLQIFTKPLHSRPTWFLEIIERRGSRGFGAGNIKALYEAVEAEQAKRGNLS